MADLTEIQAAQSVKIIGSDSTGLETEAITFSHEIGLVTTKIGMDVHMLAIANGYYSFPFAIRQTAATAANATVLSMRNPAGSAKNVYIKKIVLNMDFNAGTPLGRSLQIYNVVRLTTATPTGGTAIGISSRDASDAASVVTDVRFLDTGLTVAGVLFGNNILGIACGAVDGLSSDYDEQDVGIKLAAGEGLAIRLGVAAVVGQELSGSFTWSER